MIAANELRVGNWLLYTPGPENVQMHGGNFNILAMLQNLGGSFELGKVKVEKLGEDEINELPASQFSPIPITQEILFKAGFQDKGEYLELKIDDQTRFVHFKEHHDVTLRRHFNGDEDKIKNSTLWVHQLQNLHFALTEEELEIGC